MSDPILDLPMGVNDVEAATIRDYLKAIVSNVWSKGEGFSGKRPFGNSGWERELYYPLVKAGVATGKLGDGPWIDDITREERDEAHVIIADAINRL